ncbi:MAG: hypothetical protein HC851_15590 [Acaryochloris sp. RU_4_1]|nr:hypothetical protein [Acaryochloris sp. RU_4_1]NJR55856.1 hypothetical protein [Acaryochloris sp. CRU_2_0]
MEIKTDDYRVWYESAVGTVFFKGFLRLPGIPEYQSIMNLMLGAIAQSPHLILDLQELEFLNSSGISMLSMFVVKVRNQGDAQLTLQGSNKVFWQTKSLRNLQRLMPALNLVYSH